MEITFAILNGRVFLFKKSKKKAKEFYNQIIALPDANYDINIESHKRLKRDLGE